MKTIAVVIAAAERADEALRAAVGLTLRGDRVIVVPLVALGAGERAQRALGTLRALGHRTDGHMADAEAADVVEVWTAGGTDAVRAAIDDMPADAFLDGFFVSGATLDLSGEVCPFTFVRTKLALEEMAPGDRLRVVVDHEPATRNVPRSVTEWGQRVLGVDAIAPGRWAILIEKGTG